MIVLRHQLEPPDPIPPHRLSGRSRGSRHFV